MKTQNDMVLEHLRAKGTITPMEAMNQYGIMRLGARIWDLKRDGHRITRRLVSGKNRFGLRVDFAEYRLEENNVKSDYDTRQADENP